MIEEDNSNVIKFPVMPNKPNEAEYFAITKDSLVSVDLSKLRKEFATRFIISDEDAGTL